MKNAPVLFAAGAAGSLALVAARPAHALGPIDVEVGAKVGVGSNPAGNNTLTAVGASNPLGFGLGARGGVSFMGLYGGLDLMYYFGTSASPSVPPGASFAASQHALLYGVEGGYSLSLGPLTIRPQVGVGNATSTVDISGPASGSASQSNLYIEPGVTGLVSLAGWFAGADVNVLFLPGLDHSNAAGTFHGQVGLKF